jgi:hypothetical protein
VNEESGGCCIYDGKEICMQKFDGESCRKEINLGNLVIVGRII